MELGSSSSRKRSDRDKENPSRGDKKEPKKSKSSKKKDKKSKKDKTKKSSSSGNMEWNDPNSIPLGLSSAEPTRVRRTTGGQVTAVPNFPAPEPPAAVARVKQPVQRPFRTAPPSDGSLPTIPTSLADMFAATGTSASRPSSQRTAAVTSNNRGIPTGRPITTQQDSEIIAEDRDEEDDSDEYTPAPAPAAAAAITVPTEIHTTSNPHTNSDWSDDDDDDEEEFDEGAWVDLSTVEDDDPVMDEFFRMRATRSGPGSASRQQHPGLLSRGFEFQRDAPGRTRPSRPVEFNNNDTTFIPHAFASIANSVACAKIDDTGTTWKQRSVPDCTRLVPPEMAKFSPHQMIQVDGPGNVVTWDGAALSYKCMDKIDFNTLIIEGELQAKLEYRRFFVKNPDGSTSAPSHQLVVKQSDDSLLRTVGHDREPWSLYVTYIKKGVGVGRRRPTTSILARDQPCQIPHAIQLYQHCGSCCDERNQFQRPTAAAASDGGGRIRGLRDNDLIPLHETIARQRYRLLPSGEYTIMHISTRPPCIADTWDAEITVESYTRRATRLRHNEAAYIELSGNENKICFMDLFGGAKMDILTTPHEPHPILKLDRFQATLVNNCTLSMHDAGVFGELIVSCQDRSTFTGNNSLTVYSMLAMCTSGCVVSGCNIIDILDGYMARDGKLEMGDSVPESVTVSHYQPRSGTWVRQNQTRRRDSVPPLLGDEGFTSEELNNNPMSLFMGLMAPMIVDGGGVGIRGMRIAGASDRELLQRVMRDSMNTQTQAPKDPIATRVISIAKKPKNMEDQTPAPDKERECRACLTYKSTHLCLPCGCRTFCDWCVNEMCDPAKKLEATCPMCRAVVDKFIVIRE